MTKRIIVSVGHGRVSSWSRRVEANVGAAAKNARKDGFAAAIQRTRGGA
ncbi:hypothetical protein [Methylosinus sp. Sm6]|nr:hypothetical protein [Methylosinus sp. Sm6]MBY6241496.1 hypothetical protein [Methylosinus sp. Sm6]